MPELRELISKRDFNGLREILCNFPPADVAEIFVDLKAGDEAICLRMLPRGLVTAVLALEVVNDRGQVFDFLPAMAFTVVLVTNLFIVWGAVRAGGSESEPQSSLPVAEPPLAEAAGESA